MNILPNDTVYFSNKSSTAIVLCTFGAYNKHKKTQACLKTPIDGKRYWNINDLNKVV